MNVTKEELVSLVRSCYHMEKSFGRKGKSLMKRILTLCVHTLNGSGLIVDRTEMRLVLTNEVPRCMASDALLGDVSCVPPRRLSAKETKKKMTWIRNQPVHAQRSQEWYDFRKDMITMSDLYKVFAGPGTRNQLIKSKTGSTTSATVSRSGGGKACRHGIKYEPVVQMLYERRYNTDLAEFGCIRHRDHAMLGASPDGVNTERNASLFGRLVEIKCPTTRPIVQGEVPEKYAIQIQGQLECLNLEECDYIECRFHELGESGADDDDDNAGGVLIECTDHEGEYVYKYGPLSLQTTEEQNQWVETEIDSILKSPELHFLRVTRWKLVEENIVLVRRNRRWFKENLLKIKQLWEEILQKRLEGVSSATTALQPPPSLKKSNQVCMFIDTM
jgi:putative phage-type endonuclease